MLTKLSRAATAARHIAFGTLLLVASACNDSSAAGPTRQASFSATIDGLGYYALPVSTFAEGHAGGNFTLVGAMFGIEAPAISITLYNITGAGNYPLGVGATVPGGIASVGLGTATWTTPLSGAAGEVQISQVSATHISGTFSFVAPPASLGAFGDRTVEAGGFDIPVDGTESVAVPAYAGSIVTGTLADSAWNAANVVTVSPASSGTLSIGASTATRNISMVLSGWTGAGTYTLNTGAQRQITVTTVGGTPLTWGGAGALSAGTVTVSSATSTRIEGYIEATLQPGAVNPGPGPVDLNANFSIGVAP